MVLVITSCRAYHYASPTHPVVLEAPKQLNQVELAKVVLYSLARRHWSIEYYDLTSINASYRRLPIHIEMKAGKTITITHRLGGKITGSNKRYFTRWFANLNRTIIRVSLNEEDDYNLNEKLKKYKLSPTRLERLGKIADQ